MKAITRPEVKFWAFIIGVLLTAVIWGVRLEGRVSAAENTNSNVITRLDRIERNQIKIMINLGIQP